MIALIWFVLAALASPFKSKIRLEAENAALGHQVIVLRRKLRGRVRLTNHNRWYFGQLCRWFPSIQTVITTQPETLVRWHRARFRCYWRWKSRRRGGRPRIEADLRALIRQMSTENVLWGAPRIHGKLLKLGFSVAQSGVAKYMVKRRGPRSQGWKSFLRNHTPDIAAMDLFVVPTIGIDAALGASDRVRSFGEVMFPADNSKAIAPGREGADVGAGECSTPGSPRHRLIGRGNSSSASSRLKFSPAPARSASV